MIGVWLTLDRNDDKQIAEMRVWNVEWAKEERIGGRELQTERIHGMH